eukprot:TRINITY_DN13322_c0_g1_i1.p1 TRINITY_DN13322_c0_g1~~TRINITY_DN13322_c0_g1_i1.p1  ORF type:complete len:220 (-),score=3.08 TRINITY_DN13322_c0_g1_i1:178-837(-)
MDQIRAEDARICWVCFDEDKQNETWIHPCRCSGSVKWVHRSCIDSWLERSHSVQCPTCQCNYKFETSYYYKQVQNTLTDQNNPFYNIRHWVKNIAHIFSPFLSATLSSFAFYTIPSNWRLSQLFFGHLFISWVFPVEGTILWYDFEEWVLDRARKKSFNSWITYFFFTRTYFRQDCPLPTPLLRIFYLIDFYYYLGASLFTELEKCSSQEILNYDCEST